MKPISIFGTSSDAGKSTLTFVIGKLIQNKGYRVAPFKAQNVSNNSRVADDGSEIAIAQYFQAEVLEIPTSCHLNPILLKSGRRKSASLIIQGKSIAEKEVMEYYRDLDTLKPAVDDSLKHLMQEYECVICEGAGSPVELNLMDKDLSNLYIAERFETKIILVADIERGGVFASIWGVYNLLPEHLRQNIIGVIINKFRGDMRLFDEGVKIIEERFGIPVLGVLPYMSLNLGFEDSASLFNYSQTKPEAKISAGVIAYPTMSNYNDLEPLIADTEVHVEWITANVPLQMYDLIILPGSKLTISDLQWLKRNGLFERLKNFSGTIYGICGGFEMMFKSLQDSHTIENLEPIFEEALGWIDDVIVFETEKHLHQGSYTLFGHRIEGFEIRHGKSGSGITSFEHRNIRGSFIHGVFENDNLRTALLRSINSEYVGYDFKQYKRSVINTFVNRCGERIDIERILKYVL